MTGVDRLNHALCVRTVIGSDHGGGFRCLFREDGWRKGKRMKIGAFCCIPRPRPVSQISVELTRVDAGLTDCGVLKDDQEARIIDPLDLKSSANIFPLYESGLYIPRLQLFRKAGKRKDAGDASGELVE